MKRILKDWTHWGGKGYHFGFHRRGNCWFFRFGKTRFSNCTHYWFWRFFIAFDRKPESETDYF